MLDRISDAIAQSEQAIEAHPENCNAYWQLGLLHLLQGDEEQAQAIWWSGLMVAAESDLANLLNLLLSEADRQKAQDRFDLAEVLYRQGIALQADQAEIHCRLGQVVALQGGLDEAIDHWQQAIELAPDWHEPYIQQGQVWEKLGQDESAVIAYQQAIQLNWDHETALGLGRCLLRLRQWAAAIEVFQLIAEQQASSAVLADLGWGWLRLGHLEQAIQYFHQALWQRSNFAETYCAWIQALACQGRAEPEQSLQSELLQQVAQPESPEAISQFAQSFNQLIDRRSHKSAAPSPSLDQETPALSFYETTQAWATEQEADRYIPLEPPSLLTLTPPKTLNSDIHFSFRFPRQIELPGAFVAQIPQGQVWAAADQSSVAIFTANHQLLGDLSAEFPLLSPGHPDQHPSHHSALSRHLLPVQKIEGTVAVLSGLTDDMYFHWMLEVLPRINLLQRSGISLEAIDHFLVHHHLPFQQQTLTQLGIPADKILAIDGEIHLQATTLITPSFPASPAWMPRWTCDFLRRSFLPDQTIVGDRRLYLSRQETANRRLINETAVWSVLEKFGFEAVTLETLSVTEQAELLAQAAAVISPHGSGLTNLAFCNPGTKVIELFSPEFVYPCYWLLSNWMELEYFYLTGTTPLGSGLQSLFYPNPRLADIWIEIAQLEVLLKQVLA